MSTFLWKYTLVGKLTPILHQKDNLDETDRKSILIVARHKLPPEHSLLTLDELAKLYPPPVLRESGGVKTILPGV